MGWVDTMRALVDQYDAQAVGPRRPACGYIFRSDQDSVKTAVANDHETTVATLLTSLTKSRRGRKVVRSAPALAVVHARPTYPAEVLDAMSAALDADPADDLTRFGDAADYPDARQYVVVQLVSRDGWIGETGRLSGRDWSGSSATTNDDMFTLHDEPEIAALITALRETGDYVHRDNPRDTAVTSALLPDLFPVARDIADRYDAIRGWDRPPRLYTLGFDLAALSEIPGAPGDHPVAFLNRVMNDPDARATVSASYLLGLVAESWTFPPDTLAELVAAHRSNPDLDIAATFGTPSQHPRRVELIHVSLMTRDGRHAGLSRPRSPEDADAEFLSTDRGDAITGNIPTELAHMFAVTD